MEIDRPFIGNLTEEQIERRVERMIDGIDHVYLTTSMARAEYDALIRAVDAWAEREYRHAKLEG